MSIQPSSSSFFSSWNPSVLENCYGGGCGATLIGQEYNGRINIETLENPDIQFKMYERVASKNKSECIYAQSMKGILEPNVLSQVFFSQGNMQILQNGLRAGVNAKSGGKYFLPPQNVDALSIIMRSTFLNHANFYESESESVTKQVEELNAKVLDYAVPQLYNASVGYEQYLRDQSTLVVPLAQPLNHDRNYKELELKPFMNTKRNQ